MPRARTRLERINITRDEHYFVRRRVMPLVAQHLDRPLLDLLGDAYCQGLTDMADIKANREIAP